MLINEYTLRRCIIQVQVYNMNQFDNLVKWLIRWFPEISGNIDIVYINEDFNLFAKL